MRGYDLQPAHVPYGGRLFHLGSCKMSFEVVRRRGEVPHVLVRLADGDGANPVEVVLRSEAAVDWFEWEFAVTLSRMRADFGPPPLRKLTEPPTSPAPPSRWRRLLDWLTGRDRPPHETDE